MKQMRRQLLLLLFTTTLALTVHAENRLCSQVFASADLPYSVEKLANAKTRLALMAEEGLLLGQTDPRLLEAAGMTVNDPKAGLCSTACAVNILSAFINPYLKTTQLDPVPLARDFLDHATGLSKEFPDPRYGFPIELIGSPLQRVAEKNGVSLEVTVKTLAEGPLSLIDVYSTDPKEIVLLGIWTEKGNHALLVSKLDPISREIQLIDPNNPSGFLKSYITPLKFSDRQTETINFKFPDLPSNQKNGGILKIVRVKHISAIDSLDPSIYARDKKLDKTLSGPRHMDRQTDPVIRDAGKRLFTPVVFTRSEAEGVLVSLLNQATGYEAHSFQEILKIKEIDNTLWRVRGLYPHISDVEALAVWYYTQDGYRIVNQPLRERTALTREQAIFASLIFSGTSKAPVVTKTVLRKAVIPEELKGKYLQGNVVRYESFLSTAQDYVSMSAMKHLKGRTDVVTFHILPKGSAHNIEEMSTQPIETEALFLPGTSFLIKEIQGNDFYLEEVDASLGFDFQASAGRNKNMQSPLSRHALAA